MKIFDKIKQSILEDGIIDEILKRTGLIKKEIQCCEFGAWDGMHLSNTFNLVTNFSAKAVYIEGDANKFLDQVKTPKKYSNIVPIKKIVGLGKEELLDNIKDINTLDFFIRTGKTKNNIK